MFKVTIETLEQGWRRSGIFIVNFQHISHLWILKLPKHLFSNFLHPLFKIYTCFF